MSQEDPFYANKIFSGYFLGYFCAEKYQRRQNGRRGRCPTKFTRPPQTSKREVQRSICSKSATSPPFSHGRQICRKRVANDGHWGQNYVCGSPTNAFKSFYFHLVCVCLSQTTVQGVWRPQSTIMGFGSRHCYVCDSENVDKNGFFEHMEGHSEDLKRFKFSNNTSDACRTSCKLCGRMVQLQRMR